MKSMTHVTASVVTLFMHKPMKYQVLYTMSGASPYQSYVCANMYVTARTYMEAWDKGTALAVGHERVADVIPCTN